MSNWAYVENNQVTDLYYDLPTNWRNISNFFTLADNLAFLQTFGWYPVEKVTPSFNSSTQELSAPRFEITDDKVLEIRDIIDLPVIPQEVLLNQQWNVIKAERDQLMIQNDWRYARNSREIRLGLTPTETLETIDNYMQALADITKQTDPFNIIWPTYNGV